MEVLMFRMLLAIMVFLMMTASAWATCPDAVGAAALMKSVELGEGAFALMDRDEFLARRNQAIETVACLNEQVSQIEAARLHRLLALAAFIQKDRERAVIELAVSRRLDPRYVFPEGLIPIGHPISGLYEKAAAVVPSGELQTVLAPVGGWVLVDGERTDARRSTESAIVQIVAGNGKIIESRFVKPLEIMPDLDLSQFNMTLPTRQSVFKSQPRSWFIATGASAVVTGGFYAAGMLTKSRLYDTDDPVPDNRVQPLTKRVNAFGLAFAGSGLLTAGLGAVTFTVVVPNHRRSAS